MKLASFNLIAALSLIALTVGCSSQFSSAPVDVDLEELGINAADAADHEVVVLKFGANWCPPCRRVDKELERLRETHGGSVIVKKVDIDRDRSLGQKFGVGSIPRIFLIKDGKRIDDVVGYRSHDDLARWVEDAGARPGGGSKIVINTMENTNAKPATIKPTSSRNRDGAAGSIKLNPYL